MNSQLKIKLAPTPETDQCVKANKHLRFLQEDHYVGNSKTTYENPIVFLSRKLERERNEWKAKYIQQNKDLGCEMMDPNGTIWDYAKKVQTDLASMTEQRDRLAEVLLALRNNESFSIGGAAYEIVEQALQSLNQPTKP